MKKCFKCGIEKPLTDFYTHPQMADGHLNKCSSCTRRDVRQNRARNAAHYREYDRERYQNDAARRAEQTRTYREMNARYPERRKARVAVSNALRDGRLVRLPCEVCGTTANIEAHHDDYSRPLDVRWLCREHHNDHHHRLDAAS